MDEGEKRGAAWRTCEQGGGVWRGSLSGGRNGGERVRMAGRVGELAMREVRCEDRAKRDRRTRVKRGLEKREGARWFLLKVRVRVGTMPGLKRRSPNVKQLKESGGGGRLGIVLIVHTVLIEESREQSSPTASRAAAR